MPTSDADRYARLLQNLSLRIRAIREAIERAFGVTLPTAATLNAEFEIITRAIYAAADQPRPVPVTDDKPTTRTHFVYRIDIWAKDGKTSLSTSPAWRTSLLRGRRIGLRATVGQTQGSPCVKAPGSWRIAAAELSRCVSE
jgi:hypothetical protein